jgi:predicted amidohydrolase YtcJ
VNNYYSFDPFWTQILGRLPGMAGVDIAASTRQAMADYNAKGVTAVYEGHNMTRAHVGVYEQLHAEQALTVRVMAAMETQINAFAPFEPMTLDEYGASLELARSLRRPGDDWLRIEGATLAAGGPAWPGLLRMHEPYKGPYGQPTRGITFAGPELHDAFVRFCARHDLRANFCNAGDRDHDDVFDALARSGVDPRGRHWLVQHAIVIRPSQVRRFADLGFDLTTSMSFSWGKGDMYGERLGRDVWRDLIPLKRLVDSGMRVGCGSDWGPKNFFEHMLLAETHEFAGSGHRNDGPDHAVDRALSVSLWTDRAAEVLGWQGIGTLRAGSHADLIVLDHDPLACRQDDLPGTQVLRTLVGGAVVHDTGALAAA